MPMHAAGHAALGRAADTLWPGSNVPQQPTDETVTVTYQTMVCYDIELVQYQYVCVTKVSDLHDTSRMYQTQYTMSYAGTMECAHVQPGLSVVLTMKCMS